jgi:hypothetical protein
MPEWLELSPIKWVAELGTGPVSPTRPEVVCRRLLVRSTGARHRCGYTAIVTDLPPEVLPTAELEPFYEARQTIEGWLSEATAALQLKGVWSRSFRGLSAFLVYATLACNLLNWWLRRQLRAPGNPCSACASSSAASSLSQRDWCARSRVTSCCSCRPPTRMPPGWPVPRPAGNSRCPSLTSARVMRISDA